MRKHPLTQGTLVNKSKEHQIIIIYLCVYQLKKAEREEDDGMRTLQWNIEVKTWRPFLYSSSIAFELR